LKIRLVVYLVKFLDLWVDLVYTTQFDLALLLRLLVASSILVKCVNRSSFDEMVC